MDNIELASEFENDGNNLLEGSNITVSEVHANSRHQSVIPGELQDHLNNALNNVLIAERIMYKREILMCHLNINSIQNKFEELAGLIKDSRTQLMILANLKLTLPTQTVNFLSLVLCSTVMIGTKEEEEF